MNELKIIGKEEALEITPDFYKPTVQYIYGSALLPGEKVLFISKATRHDLYENRYWSEFSSSYKTEKRYDNTASLVVLTNQRWIRKWSRASHEQGLLFANKDKKERIFGSLKSGFRWREPVHQPPDPKHPERKGKSLDEWAMSSLRFLSLSEIKPPGKRIRYTNTKEGQRTYVMISLNGADYSFPFEQGEKLFQVLQVAASHSGKIPLEGDLENVPVASDDSLQARLQKLKAFFEADLITSKEYEQKKAEILDDL